MGSVGGRLTVVTERQRRSLAGTLFAGDKPRIVEIKGITRSLLPETFESYSRAEARADELNRQERVMALRAFA